MDLHSEIISTLEFEGCTIKQHAGIYYVKTPDGSIWDFTVPQVSVNKTPFEFDEL